MSVASVGFVPAAPLLIPSVAAGSAGLDEALRASCLEVTTRALAPPLDEVVVVACVPSPREWPPDSTWDFSGFGVVRDPPDPRATLPWSLGIGAWLLDECAWIGRRRYIGVDGRGGVPAAASLTSDDGTRSILVVGDGSACRSERAPGHLDERAESFDLAVADALARGDVGNLAGLDAVLAEQLMCQGLPAWHWTAAAIGGAAIANAELLTHVAPYGVGYFVALWSLA